jgi:hypothetical protein
VHHLLIAIALLAFAALDVIFVEFSDTPAAALTFAAMSFLVLLLLSGSAGSFGREPEDYTTLFGPMLGPGLKGFLTRIVLASVIPVVLLVALAYVPDLNDPLDPSETVQLGSILAGFWLLMSLALVGAVLGFLWPRSGALDAVVVGGLVVLIQSLLSWAKFDASRDAVQLALYTSMVWVSVCLIGAWVGFALRQVSDHYLLRARGDEPERAPASPGSSASESQPAGEA